MPAHDNRHDPRLGGRMSSGELATRYFKALAGRDIDAAEAPTP
jgi:hypothetical protein